MPIRTLAPVSLLLPLALALALATLLAACDTTTLAPCPPGSIRVGDACRAAPRDAGSSSLEGDGGFEEPDGGFEEPDGGFEEPDAPATPDGGAPCVPAEESCNTLDDDCDGTIDEESGVPFFPDDDADGFGTGAAVIACTPPDGHARIEGDCDDARADVHPEGAETCDRLDQDCDGAIDEGVLSTFYLDADRDGFGVGSVTMLACAVSDGFAAIDGDCDDACPSCHPGGTEVCDDLDQDCDGDAVEDALRSTYFVDSDGDGYSPRIEGAQRLCAVSAGWTDRVPSPEQRDCQDSQGDAHPMQSGYFTAPMSGVGGAIPPWDYDCSGAIEGQYARGGSCDTGIACTGRTGVFVGTTIVPCGASAPFQASCGRVLEGGIFVCRSVVTMVTQSCH